MTDYIVTDAEFDGPMPGTHSMLSVAVTAAGEKRGEFETVLQRLPGAATNPETMAFWQKYPEAFAAATHNPEAPETVMPRFVDWVRSLGGSPIFASHPAGLDGPWIDFYLQRFANERLLEGPWRPNRLFRAAPFCLATFAAGRLGWPVMKCSVSRYSPEWLGNQPHTHRAIDDARGYAFFLGYLMGLKTVIPA